MAHDYYNNFIKKRMSLIIVNLLLPTCVCIDSWILLQILGLEKRCFQNLVQPLKQRKEFKNSLKKFYKYIIIYTNLNT